MGWKPKKKGWGYTHTGLTRSRYGTKSYSGGSRRRGSSLFSGRKCRGDSHSLSPSEENIVAYVVIVLIALFVLGIFGLVFYRMMNPNPYM